jgi:hypothetical protein
VRLVRDINVLTQSVTGVVAGMNVAHKRLTVARVPGRLPLTLAMAPDGVISGPKGRKRPLSALHAGASVRVSVTYNTRLHRYVAAHQVSVLAG